MKLLAYENRKSAVLDKFAEEQFKSRPKAWSFFQGQPGSYRQTLIWWVASAKKEETQKLIAHSKAGKRV